MRNVLLPVVLAFALGAIASAQITYDFSTIDVPGSRLTRLTTSIAEGT